MFKLRQNEQTQDQELKTLQQERRKLTAEIVTLSAKARSTNFIPEKKRIQQTKAEFSRKRTKITSQINNIHEKQALPNTEVLFKKNLNRILLTANDYKIDIDTETLIVKITFSCGHQINLPVYELLRHQSTLKSNRELYAKWHAIISNSETISGAFLCETCLANKKKEQQKRGVFASARNTGQANWRLEIR